MNIYSKLNFVFAILAILFVPVFSNAQTSSQCLLEVGNFYTHPDTNSVWKVVQSPDSDSCTKRPVSSSRVFFTHADSWNVVETTTKTNIGSIPDDEASFLPWGPKYDPKGGALIKVPNDSKVYLLLDGKKYWITNESIFNELNYKWNWVQDASKGLLDKYETKGEINSTDHHPAGTLIKYKGSNKVYKIEKDENGNLIKRHIKDEQVFDQLGYRFDRVVTIDDTEEYLDGDPIEKKDNKKQSSDTKTDKENTAFNESKVEQLVHKKVNDIREKNGLNELELDPELSKVADGHSKDMGERDYYSHYTPEGDSFRDRYDQANYTCQNYGAENIAKAQWGVRITTYGSEFHTVTEEEMAEVFMHMWLNSSGHKGTMLMDRWVKQGLGVEKTADDWVYITQDFC